MNMKNSLVCLVTALGLSGPSQAGTIAYWPMNLTQGTSSRTVKDSSASQYDLTVRAEALGGVSFSSNDIGWTLPPNPDADGAASAQYMTSSPGEKSGSSYLPVLTSYSGELGSKLGGDRDFTLEGWIRLTDVPQSGSQYLLAMNTLASKGGWACQFRESSVSGVYTIKVDSNTTGSRTVYDLKVCLTPSEVLNKWNHFALVRVAAVSETTSGWRFYLNGRLRGSNDTSPRIQDVSSLSSFYVSGANSGAAQQIVGDLLCWRASDEVLSEGRFLCDVQPSDTVAYWPMNVITVGNRQVVTSSTGPDADLTLRDSTKGGVEVVANDIGWTKPANPDPQSDNSAVWTSDAALSVSEGSASYQAVLSSSSRRLDAALTPTNDFCIEGWYCATNLPSDSSSNHLMVFSTLGSYGGWVWNIYGADNDGACSVSVMQEVGYKNQTGSKRSVYALGSIRSDLVLNRWNHYALAYDVERVRWKFYFNGRLVGVADGTAISDVPSRTPTIYLFGCNSGKAQIPQGRVTTWRLSRGKFDLTRFLCGDMTDSNTLTWTGAKSTDWSAAADMNWKDDSESSCAWQDNMRACFDGAANVTIGGEVNPNVVTVKGDENVLMTFSSGGFIGKMCEGIVKEGSGELHLTASGSSMNKSSNRILVNGGTLRVSNPFGRNSLGDVTSEAGCEVRVSAGATLAVDQRHALGYPEISMATHSRIVVFTNGTFDLSCPSDVFNIQTLSWLKLIGGCLVPPAKGHQSGWLQIRDGVSFGRNPGRTPYVFDQSAGEWDEMTWQYGTNTVFEVADITEDGDPDVIFNCHVLALKSWQDATDACCFRKTGDGTMVLRQSRDGYLDTNVCYPTGEKAVNAVEAGELRIDCDYSGPSFNVLSGAYLSGTGAVSAVSFEAGAGFKGVFGAPCCLTVVGDCTIKGEGVVSLRTQGVNRSSVRLATIGGSILGEAHLATWRVVVDGEQQNAFYVVRRGQSLVAKSDAGLMVIVR